MMKKQPARSNGRSASALIDLNCYVMPCIDTWCVFAPR